MGGEWNEAKLGLVQLSVSLSDFYQTWPKVAIRQNEVNWALLCWAIESGKTMPTQLDLWLSMQVAPPKVWQSSWPAFRGRYDITECRCLNKYMVKRMREMKTM